MSYEKQTWKTGDIITAEGLNNLEDGVQEALECCGGESVESPIFIADVTATQSGNNWTCTSDIVLSDLRDAYNSGKVIFVRFTKAPENYPEDYWDKCTLFMTNFVSGSVMNFYGFTGLTPPSEQKLRCDVTGWYYVVS